MTSSPYASGCNSRSRVHQAVSRLNEVLEGLTSEGDVDTASNLATENDDDDSVEEAQRGLTMLTSIGSHLLRTGIIKSDMNAAVAANVSTMQIAFDRLHTTLAWPYSAEALALEADGISKLEAQERRIKIALACLATMRSTLRRDLAVIHQQSNQLKCDHPISKLPPELLSHIFVLRSRFRYRSNGGRIHEHPGPPNQLSQVSSHWRAVALATPSLWDHMEISGSRKSLEKLKAWLPRSGSLPFSLELHLYGRRSSMDVKELTAIIIPHLHRLEELDFTAGHIRHLDLIGFLAAASDPHTTYRLRDISLSLSYDAERQASSTIPPYQYSLFDNVHLVRTQSVCWEGWETWQVERLEITGSRRLPSNWQGILHPLASGLSNLHFLDIRVSDELQGPLDEGRRINLPQLSTLKIQMQDKDISAFFSALDAPLVEIVDIQIMPTEAQADYLFFPAFAARATNLRNLRLVKSFTMKSASRLVNMLQMMPSIEALTISGVARDKFNNSDCLVALPEAIAELPNLRTFTMEKGALHQETLGRIVRSFRKRVAFYVGTCSLFVTDNITPDEWDDFEAEMLDDFEDHVNVLGWEEVTFETPEDAGEFDYD